ncbi:spore coat protein YsxE [Metabacillus sp. RGM 3146]|uniref:spore coat protein YsxE n=1 Tax=Metabacillus sp. RGM 3146 TaxID=3401092 RepID=UPI003B9D48DC
MMEEVSNILSQYQMEPEFAEQITQNLLKVYTKHGVFGLKKMKENRNYYFPELLGELQQKGFSDLVPVYQNQAGSYLTPVNQQYYYLMPWFQDEQEEERDSKHDYFFKEIALLHGRTLKEVSFTAKDSELHHERLTKKWNKDIYDYERFVEKCEKQWYLSPFELQAVTYYMEVSRASEFAREKLNEWKEEMAEKENGRMVLNHGRLSIRHFIYDRDGKPYLTNFEKAHYSNPIDDMLQFFARTFKTYPIRCDECVDWFYSYQRQFPYSKEETSLFLSYLAYPEPILQSIRSYAEKQERRSELDYNRGLMQAYWTFKNVEYFVMRVTEIENQKKMAQNAST